MTNETPSNHTSSSPTTRRGPTGFGGIRLGTISGFEISLDYSWFIIFFLILGTFIGAVFPHHAPGLDRTEYLAMGIVGTILFFVSLLAHELAHSFMARWKGIDVEGITLFIFGGMARTSREADTPWDEFLIAGVGPLASFALALFFYALALGGSQLGLGLAITVVAEYLGLLNLVLAIFNLLPGFPLDGGRLLRAMIWQLTGSFRRATRIAALAGRSLGWGIIALGIFSLLVGGGLIGGLWLVFIGWFLTYAARMSYQQVLLHEMLKPLTARQAMSPNPERVPPDLPIEELIHEYFLRRPYNSFPVTDDGIVVGLVTLGQVKLLAREQWRERVVADVMSPLKDTVLVDPETTMLSVLERMQGSETRRVLVAREWELLGIISATDITRWLDRVGLVE